MNYEIGEIWKECLKILERDISSVAFKTWIDLLEPLRIQDGSFILLAPDSATRETVEKRHLDKLEQVVLAVCERDLDVKIWVMSDAHLAEGDVRVVGNKRGAYSYTLKPKYMFDNFVRGKSNEMAFAASQAVAESPGKTRYNPLFLYAKVGLGKTHLMNAIGNKILHDDPECNILYTSAENMMNEFVASIREKKNQEFRDKYRKLDVLLIDDIQFLTDKEGTQEEFFHTFNALKEDGKQLVISSDRPPMELKTLEERLRSRFGSGLMVDISQPDFETRLAILEKKLEFEHVVIPKEVLRHIAKKISSNIRELEGAFNKVAAYPKLAMINPITIELTDSILRDVVDENANRDITVDYIQTVVANHFGISKADIIGPSRIQKITYCRHIAMYMARMILDTQQTKLGEEFGGRDHSTVIHACNKISAEMDKNPSVKDLIIELEKKIKGE